MHKIWIVARHEFLMNLKKPGFLLSAFGVPLFVVIVWAIIFSVADSESTFEGNVGYIDLANVISADAEWETEIDSQLIAYASTDEAQAALDDNEISAYFVVAENYMNTGEIDLYSYGSAPDSLRYDINSYLAQSVANSIDSVVDSARLQDPLDMTVVIMDSGRELTESSLIGLILTPMLFVMIYMLSSQLSGGYLMAGVVEEKGNHIMEILITSINPMQMLMGKLLGLGALGLLQLLVWIVIALGTVLLGDRFPFLANVVIPVDMMAISVIYFFLSYFMIASFMAGVGVVVGSEQESRQYSSILSMLTVIPFFFIVSFMDDPNGTIPIILSLFPMTAGIAMILRMAFATVPLEQIILSLTILFATSVFVTWASAKIFRWATLLYGNKANIRLIIRVLRGSPEIGSIPVKASEVS